MKENKNIVKKPGDFSRVYCQEEYAQELYDKMNGIEIIPKDLKEGDVLGVQDFKILKNGEVVVICDNFDSLYFTLSKERKYFELWGQDE